MALDDVASGKINDDGSISANRFMQEKKKAPQELERELLFHMEKCDAVSKPGLAAMVIKNGVDFDSLDGEPVTLLFLIAAPNTEDNVHLDVLSKLSMMLMDEEFTEALRNATSCGGISYESLIRQMKRRAEH